MPVLEICFPRGQRFLTAMGKQNILLALKGAIVLRDHSRLLKREAKSLGQNEFWSSAANRLYYIK